MLGGLGGVCVDAQDHVLILNRQDVVDGDLNGARLAPPLIEFDAAGNVVNSWGDLKVMDPRLHSCHFDPDGNDWEFIQYLTDNPAKRHDYTIPDK